MGLAAARVLAGGRALGRGQLAVTATAFQAGVGAGGITAMAGALLQQNTRDEQLDMVNLPRRSHEHRNGDIQARSTLFENCLFRVSTCGHFGSVWKLVVCVSPYDPSTLESLNSRCQRQPDSRQGITWAWGSNAEFRGPATWVSSGLRARALIHLPLGPIFLPTTSSNSAAGGRNF